MRFFGCILFLSLFFHGCANAPGPDYPPVVKVSFKPPSPVALMVQQYSRYFSREMQLTNTPGAALVIVKDSQVVFMQGYGLRVAGKPDSIDVHTVFRIGSLSKGFAGVLTGIMVQDSLLSWEDPVQKYYPAFTLRDRKQAARVQLWHLLSHTCGLPYHAFTNLIEKDFSIDHIVKDYFPMAPVSGKEGEFYAYQNAALCVIEAVMQGKTNHSYAQLLAEKILGPCGMVNSSCDYESIQRNPNKTYPHVPISSVGWRADSISPLYYNAVAAGGVNASISDMGQWLITLLGHRTAVVSNNTLDRVFRPVVKTDKERAIFPHWLPRNAASYALGWRVLENAGETIIYHGGYVNGYKSEIALDRKAGIGICVLFNANTGLSNACIPAFFEQWNAVKG